jgi:hypothetical protein
MQKNVVIPTPVNLLFNICKKIKTDIEKSLLSKFTDFFSLFGIDNLYNTDVNTIMKRGL